MMARKQPLHVRYFRSPTPHAIHYLNTNTHTHTHTQYLYTLSSMYYTLLAARHARMLSYLSGTSGAEHPSLDSVFPSAYPLYTIGE